MNQNYENDIKWFKEIINKPENLKLLPKQYLENPDFLETFYIILGDKIKPYISKQTFETLKHREVIFKNQNMQKIKNKPNISLDDELELLHKLLTDIETINLLPTDEKYTNNCIQFLYLIWGDEIEYNLRIQREQYQVATVAQAVFHHPRANDAGTPMFFGKLRFNNPAQDLKLYCLVRNASRTYLDYKGSVYALLFVVKVMWFYMFTQPSLRRLKIVISALLDSVRGNFQGHKLYLKK